jgi:hypothetical protein
MSSASNKATVAVSRTIVRNHPLACWVCIAFSIEAPCRRTEEYLHVSNVCGDGAMHRCPRRLSVWMNPTNEELTSLEAVSWSNVA